MRKVKVKIIKEKKAEFRGGKIPGCGACGHTSPQG